MDNIQIDNKELKNMAINSYFAFIVIGIWGIILISVMINKVKSIGYTDNCIRYNDYNQCIEYK